MSARVAKPRARWKAKAARAGLAAVMNDTKWRRLFQALQPLDGMLDFRRKDIDQQSKDTVAWQGDLYHMLGGWESIEWLEIRAGRTIRRGALLAPVIEDRTQELLKAVRSSRAPYELTDEGVKVWGYLRPGTSPKWAGDAT